MGQEGLKRPLFKFFSQTQGSKSSPRLDSQPTISACLIVKNEAARLARCLESLAGVVSEIIIVDTGSTDDTVSIAQAFTEHVYHHAWNDHYADARNVGLAKATGEYILVIDADEVMVAGTAQRVLQHLARPDLQDKPWVLNWRVCSEHHRDLSTRGLFPNGYGIEFRGRVHEGLVLPGQTLSAYHCPDLVLWHDSLGAEDLAKHRYYQQLLLQSLAEETEDASLNHSLKYLGLSCLALGQWSAAWDALTQCYQGMKALGVQPRDGYYVDVLRGLVQAGLELRQVDLCKYALELNRVSPFDSLARQALELAPSRRPWRVALGSAALLAFVACQPAQMGTQSVAPIKDPSLILLTPEGVQSPGSLVELEPPTGELRIKLHEPVPGCEYPAPWSCYHPEPTPTPTPLSTPTPDPTSPPCGITSGANPGFSVTAQSPMDVDAVPFFSISANSEKKKPPVGPIPTPPDQVVQSEIATAGGSLELQGMGTVTFPSGSLETGGLVSLSNTYTEETRLDFNTTSILYDPGPRLPYEIRVNTGTLSPKQALEVELNVPRDFARSLKPLPQKAVVAVFVQRFISNEHEIHDSFEVVESAVYSESEDKIRFAVDPSLFTDVRTADQTQEVVIVIGSVLKTKQETEVAASDASSDALADFTIMAKPAGCQGKPLLSPFPGKNPQTSPFNPPIHYGTDFMVPDGTPIHAPADGVIEVINYDARPLARPDPRSGKRVKGWGHFVVLKHSDGSQTLYGHLKNTTGLKKGQKIKAGQAFLISNNSGGSSGPHLHMEYSPAGNIFNKPFKVDPFACIKVKHAGGGGGGCT